MEISRGICTVWLVLFLGFELGDRRKLADRPSEQRGQWSTYSASQGTVMGRFALDGEVDTIGSLRLDFEVCCRIG